MPVVLYAAMRRRSNTPLLLAILAFVAVTTERSALAWWTSPERVFMNTAYTLEESELTIGILSPLQYGVTDVTTISIHPVLALLLTPNISARLKVYDGPVTVSVQASYVQTFLRKVVAESDAANATAQLPYLRASDLAAIAPSGFPGTVQMGALVSVPLGTQLTLTPYLGYTFDFLTLLDNGLTTDLSTHGIAYGGGLNWLIGRTDLLSLQVQTLYSFTEQGHEIPLAALVYAHAWEEIRLGVGLAAGQFPIHTGDRNLGEVIDLPVYPYLDLWWRR